MHRRMRDRIVDVQVAKLERRQFNGVVGRLSQRELVQASLLVRQARTQGRPLASDVRVGR